MTNRIPTTLMAALLLAWPLALPNLMLPESAEAIVGRPATPGSVAGGARRTSRRTSRRVVRRHTAVAPVAVVAPAAVVVAPAPTVVVAPAAAPAAATIPIGMTIATPPSGCQDASVGGLSYLACGSTWFQPRIQAGAVVYVVVAPPG